MNRQFPRIARATMVLVCLLLVACGGADTAASLPPTDAQEEALAADTPATALADTAPADRAATGHLPVTMTDVDGNDVTIESAERIIALNGDLTEIVAALGLGEHLVGVDLSATYPPDLVAELPNIGYQYNLNAEGILALNPTVVIGKEGAGPPEVLQQVRSAGIPVLIGPDAQDIDAPAAKIRFVAQALGVPNAGDALVADLEADLATARAQLDSVESPAPRVLFLYLRGTSTQAAAGSETAADTMITAAGGINVGAEQGIENYEPLSPEVIAAAQPDVILLMESGLQSMGGIEGLFTIPGLADTPALREQRVIAMDGLYLVGLGPRTGAAILDLLPHLHPELTEADE